MRKGIPLVLSICFVFGLFLFIVPNNAQAMKKDSLSSIAEGVWTNGTSLNVSGMMDSKPEWLQLLSTEGVKMTKAGDICHPLRGGQYGWVGEIREYKNNHWIKIPTTNGWVPNLEGAYMSCAKAPEAGIYALFGYYVRPEGYVEPVSDDKPKGNDDFDCTALVWDVHLENLGGITLRLYGTVTGLPEGTQIDMTIDSSQSDPNTLGGSTNGTVTLDGSYDVVFLVYAPQVNHVFVNYSVSEYGCSYSYDHGF